MLAIGNPVTLVITPADGVPRAGVVSVKFVAVVPLGSARTPAELVLIVAEPLDDPSRMRLPPVPPFAPKVALLVPVIVVKAPLPGVVPPMAPGDGKLAVDPPRATEVPAMVMAPCVPKCEGVNSTRAVDPAEAED